MSKLTRGEEINNSFTMSETTRKIYSNDIQKIGKKTKANFGTSNMHRLNFPLKRPRKSDYA